MIRFIDHVCHDSLHIFTLGNRNRGRKQTLTKRRVKLMDRKEYVAENERTKIKEEILREKLLA